LGATGVVGREILSILEERAFPVDEVRVLASARSAGAEIRFMGDLLPVREAGPDSFEGLDLVLASAGASATRALAAAIRESGAVLVDNSSAFRMEASIPLVVPEVNADLILKHPGIIANPNCVAILLTIVLAPLQRAAGIQRVVVTTYQAASGAGRAAMEELKSQSREVLEGRPVEPKVLPHPIAFNVFSHDSVITDTGYNGEETKVMAETRKILSLPELAISVTSLRVPVVRAHTEAVNVSLERPLSADDARIILSGAPGIEVMDDRESNTFPMPSAASGKDAVYVGRIRQDLSQPGNMGIELLLCGDQLRKGAALNAVQIAEALA
jgi:aspartate-semialdehyde dehydrogenase